MIDYLQSSPLFSWFKTYLSTIFIFLLFILGITFFYHQIQHLHPHDLLVQLKTLPSEKIILSVVLTMVAYLALVGYDWSALRYIGKKLPLPFVAFTSFIGYSLSNTVGVSWLSGGAVRYRLYSHAGLTPTEITLIIAFCVVGFGIGEVLVGGVALITDPSAFAAYLPVPAWAIRTIAAALLGGFAFALIVRGRSTGEFKWKQTTFKIPSAEILSGQVVFSIVDVTFAGAALYVLLPDSQLTLFAFLPIFVIALVVSILSHVPGGIGVFEAVMIAGLPQTIPAEAVTVALVSYRVIYYLLPFLLGILLLILSEAYISVKKRWSGTEKLEGTLRGVAKVAGSSIPAAVSGATFLSGVILLIGSSVALSPKALEMLEKFWPLELFELSHILGGVIGMVLILLSFALWQRVRAALWLAGFLLIAGAALSFVQTLDYDRVVILAFILMLLITGRRHFYRQARLFSGVFNLRWFLITASAIAGFIWLLFFSFKATPYQNDLWWQFAFNDQVSRGLRTITAAISTYLVLYVIYALSPLKKVFVVPDNDELEQAVKVINQQDNKAANFVLTGDKYILWSENKTAFIMFGINRRRWITLGDPVGPDAEAYELLWQFKQQAEDNRCKAVFYQVDRANLDWYINLNFDLFKLGEEAVIHLNAFNMEDSSRKRLRQSYRKAEKEGLSFSLAMPPHAPELLDELEAISNEWLIAKHAKEKQFSLGRFDRDYLNRCPLALTHEHGKITAFANILVTGTKTEAGIDLMRHSESAAGATMEFLFISLILSLKEQGYTSFSLGMAPLSGLDDRKGARKWDKFGNLIYKKGGDFYNFDGLRQFKEKFKPDWQPKYLAVNKGSNPYMSMVEITALINGKIFR